MSRLLSQRLRNFSLIAGLLCLGLVAVPAAFAQDSTMTTVILVNTTYPTNGQITVQVTDTSTTTVPTGTVTVTINGSPQSPISLSAQTANMSQAVTAIVSQAGTYMISAVYTPTGNFMTSNSGAAQTLTISKATATINVSSVSIVYGNSPTFNTSVSGIVNGDTFPGLLGQSGTQGATTTNSTLTNGKPNAGTWNITTNAGTLASTNYTFVGSTNTGGLTVSQVALTVTPNNATITYGTASPNFVVNGYTFATFVNGDTSAVVAGAPTLSSNATITNGNPNAGTWAISGTTGALSAINYSFRMAVGTFTVNQAPLSITATAQTITYGTQANLVAGAGTVTVTGLVNGDTGTPIIAYGNNTIFSTSNNWPNATNGTPWTITANPGTIPTSNYSVTLNNANLTVNKLGITVTAQNQTITYGQSLNSTPTNTTVTVATLAGGDTATASISTNATLTNGNPNVGGGTWTITPGVGNISTSNYSFTLNNATLTVKPVQLGVTGTNATITYGNPLPTFAWSFSGFVNGDTAGSAITGSASVFPNTTTYTNGNPNAGVWVLNTGAGTLAANNNNYMFTFTNGTFRVNQAVLTIASNNPANIVYGNPFPSFTVSISGYVNADTAFTAYTGTPAASTVSGAAGTTNNNPNVGTWTITPQLGTLASINYSFSRTTGSFMVTQATLTVTPNNATITYGTATPTFTATIATLVNGDTPATAYSGSPSLASNATLNGSIANSGAWTISATAGTLVISNNNYTLAFATGTFTVNKAALTITAGNLSMMYGQSPATVAAFRRPGEGGETPTQRRRGAFGVPPSGGATYTTLLNGDTCNVTLSYSNVTNSYLAAYYDVTAAGVITPSAATCAANYAITYMTGTLTVTPLAVTLTATNQTITYGSGPNLTATLGTTYSVTAGALAAGDTNLPSLSLTGGTGTTNGKPNAGAWTVVVAANTISTTNYTLTLNNGTLTVTPVQLTVNPTALTQTYGANPNPTFASTLSGFVNGDTAAVVTGAATLGTNATVSSTGCGGGGCYNSKVSWNITVTSTAGLSATNYTFAAGSAAAFTVNPAVLTVTANNASKVYGAANPTFSATITGFVNGDPSTVVSGAAQSTTTATVSSPTGPYTITAALGSLVNTTGNYTFAFVNGTLTISGATLTVTASGSTRAYGAANSLSYSIAGFVNGDSIASVSGAPSLSSTASLSSPPGTYQVTASLGTLASTNYIFSFVPGTMIVTKLVAAAGINGLSPGVSATIGQTFTISFIVVGVPSAAVPTGTVTYTVDGAAAQTATLSNGTASVSIPGLAVGTHVVTSGYNGDTNYLATPITPATLTVMKASATLGVSVAPSSSQPQGSSFTLNLAVTVSGSTAVPTGTVSCTVDSGTAQTATLASGAATISLANLAVGSRAVACSYSGDANYPAAVASTSVTVTAASPAINSGGIASAAGVGGNLSPGGLLSIYGANLAASTASAPSLPLSTTLGGVQVLVNGAPAPALYVSPTQINVIAPYATPVGTPVQVVVVSGGVSSQPVNATFQSYAPDVFTYARTSTITDPVIVHNSSGALVTPTAPAQAGEFLTIYATGAGKLKNQPLDGAAAPASPLATTVDTPTITIAGTPAAQATVSFSGLAPGFVGLWQINAQVPATLPANTGTLSLTINIAGFSSPTFTLYVH